MINFFKKKLLTVRDLVFFSIAGTPDRKDTWTERHCDYYFQLEINYVIKLHERVLAINFTLNNLQ